MHLDNFVLIILSFDCVELNETNKINQLSQGKPTQMTTPELGQTLKHLILTLMARRKLN